MTEQTELEKQQQADADARQAALVAEEKAINDAENPTYNGKPIQTFGDTVGAKSFPDAIEVQFESIVGKPIIILDFEEKEFHYGDVAILLFEIPNMNGQLSCISGGEVVLRKLKEAKHRNLLPLIGTIEYPSGERYYDIK